MDFALGDHPKAGQITVMVEQEVKLNGPFGAAKLRPVKNTDAQVDHRGVQTDQLVFKAELLFERSLFVAALQQSKEKFLVQFPGSMFVGVGQRRTVRRFINPQMRQFPFATRKPVANLSQRVGTSQLAEHHQNKLIPAAKTTGMGLGFSFPNQKLKFASRKKLENLTEHATESIMLGLLLSGALGRLRESFPNCNPREA